MKFILQVAVCLIAVYAVQCQTNAGDRAQKQLDDYATAILNAFKTNPQKATIKTIEDKCLPDAEQTVAAIKAEVAKGPNSNPQTIITLQNKLQSQLPGGAQQAQIIAACKPKVCAT